MELRTRKGNLGLVIVRRVTALSEAASASELAQLRPVATLGSWISVPHRLLSYDYVHQMLCQARSLVEAVSIEALAHEVVQLFLSLLGQGLRVYK